MIALFAVLAVLGAAGFAGFLAGWIESGKRWMIGVSCASIVLFIVSICVILNHNGGRRDDRVAQNKALIQACLDEGGYPKVDDGYYHWLVFCYKGDGVIVDG